MKFDIKSRWSSQVIFEAEIECAVDASNGVKLSPSKRLTKAVLTCAMPTVARCVEKRANYGHGNNPLDRSTCHQLGGFLCLLPAISAER